jgi:hypothetical protein
MVIYKCDLCGQVKECRQKEIGEISSIVEPDR